MAAAETRIIVIVAGAAKTIRAKNVRAESLTRAAILRIMVSPLS
jgi:hypothetical protein